MNRRISDKECRMTKESAQSHDLLLGLCEKQMDAGNLLAATVYLCEARTISKGWK